MLEKNKSRPRPYILPCRSNNQLKIGSPQLVITSASGKTRCNRDLEFEDNNPEEADMFMICLAAQSSQRCPNAELVFFTPNTDVLKHTMASFVKGRQFQWCQVSYIFKHSGEELYLYFMHSLEQASSQE